MSSVHSAVGMVTLQDLSDYDVRTCNKGKAADNQSYVSSKTAGKTFRQPGNLDATWEISLYCKADITEVPLLLQPSKEIDVQLEHDSQLYKMIVDSSSLEVDFEGGGLVGISLSCSAVNASSYHATE